jgi:hypothetical protein
MWESSGASRMPMIVGLFDLHNRSLLLLYLVSFDIDPYLSSCARDVSAQVRGRLHL